MEQLFILTLISFIKSLPVNNPAYMDLLKFWLVLLPGLADCWDICIGEKKI
jgi:hypothetical protein